MSTDRKDTKVTRLDLRIPNDIYAQVEEIARANNATSHHITGKIILSPTLLKLISLGIESLSGNYPKLADINRTPDTSSPRIDTIEVELAEVKKLLIELSDRLSDTVPDTVSDTLSDTVPDTVSDTLSDTVPDTVSDTLSDTVPDTVSDTLSDTEIQAQSIDKPQLDNVTQIDDVVVPNKTKTDYPDWIRKNDKPFYDVLINKLELLPQVIEILKASPTLVELSNLLFEIGISSKDGKAFGTDRVGKIRYVANYLNGVEIDG